MNNNKLITIKKDIKYNNTNNYKIINLNNMKNKYQKKNKNISNSRPKHAKLSPSPNQKNIFLKKFFDKSNSKHKEIRGISGDNTRNINYNINNSIKKSKSISQNTIKKIITKNKSNSMKKGNNNKLSKNVDNRFIIYNNNNIIRKNIKILNINKPKDIMNKSERNERNISPSNKITYIYRKKE